MRTFLHLNNTGRINHRRSASCTSGGIVFCANCTEYKNNYKKQLNNYTKTLDNRETVCYNGNTVTQKRGNYTMTHTKRLLISLFKSALIILLLTVFCVISLDIIPAVEPDEISNDPEGAKPFVRLLLYFITPIPFYAIAQQFDTVKRKELLTDYKGLPLKRQIMLQTLRSFSFWSDSLFLLIPLSASSALNVVSDLLLPEREVGFLLRVGLNLICYVLPLSAVFLCIECNIRRSWFREWEFASRTSKDAILDDFVRERPSYGMLLLNIAAIGCGVWILSVIIWAVVSVLGTGVNLLRNNLIRILLILVAATAIWLLLRAMKSALARRRFIKEMRKICAEHGYRFTARKNTLGGLFFCTGREDFTLETPDKRYAGSILPVPNKKCTLYFRLDYDGGGYNFKRQFYKYSIYFPRHKLNFSRVGASECGKATERILLLTREPADLLVGDRERTWRIYSGAHSSEYTVYDATAFCHFIDRLSL